MKISVCLPTYNYFPSPLIQQIEDQAVLLELDYEILIYDDGSNDYYRTENAKLAKKNNRINHYYNIHNLGRSFARNYLANKASGTHLLFIDADSMIKSENYLENYLKYLDYPVVCGGTLYDEKNLEPGKELRYYYGIKREQVQAIKRNENANRAFATNNFLIQKSVFEKVKFREFLKKYGHEDSLFGYELKLNNFTILHIDNPVLHVGLESNRVFLSKTLEGIRNLIEIEKNNLVHKDFLKEIRLIRMAKQFRVLKYLIIFLYNRNSRRIYHHLLNSKKPSILIFDFFKLANYYIQKK